MKRTLIFAALFAAVAANARTWTLEECVDYAVEHNLTVKQQELNRKNAELEVTAARDAVLPQVSGQASQSWNFGRGLTAANTYADRNTSSFGANLGLNLPLFNGLQTLRNIDYAKVNLSAMVESVEATKDDITLRVMAQYLQALYCVELEQVAQNQVALTGEEYAKRQALLEAGKIPEADMLDAKSQAAQAKLQLVNAQNDTRLALLDLKLLLRLQEEDFVIAPLQSDVLPMLGDPQAVFDSAMQRNHGILANRLQVDAAERQIKVAETGYIPKLSFNAGLGSNYYKISGMDNEAFGEQMRHNFSQYVGFTLQVPIFDGFGTRNAVHRAKVQRLNAALNLDTQSDALYRAISESYYQAIGARERFVAADEAVTASAAALAAVQEKYNIGRATPTDFDTAKNQLLQSQSERARALYELLLRARILDFYAR